MASSCHLVGEYNDTFGIFVSILIFVDRFANSVDNKTNVTKNMKTMTMPVWLVVRHQTKQSLLLK